jgi:hypothetical protein
MARSNACGSDPERLRARAVAVGADEAGTCSSNSAACRFMSCPAHHVVQLLVHAIDPLQRSTPAERASRDRTPALPRGHLRSKVVRVRRGAPTEAGSLDSRDNNARYSGRLGTVQRRRRGRHAAARC